MAITQIVVASPPVETLYSDTNIGNTVDAIKASSGTLLYVTIGNTANVSASYVKICNLASGSVTPGTTPPDECIYVPGGATVTQTFFTGASPGKVFGTALSAFCVTTPGTGGTTAASSPVTATFAFV